MENNTEIKHALLGGKQLILATKSFAKEDRNRSWYYLITTLLLLVLSIVTTVYTPYLFLKLILGIFTGLLMMRAFISYHDFQHHSILKKSKIAKVLMTFFGLYILAPASIWKRSHDYHHNNNSKLFSASIGSYPIATVNKFRNMSRKEKLSYLTIRHPVFMFFGYITIFILGMCIGSFASTPRKHWDSLVAVFLHVVFSFLVVFFLGWSSYLAIIIIPFWITGSLGAYLFYAQHNFPSVEFNNNQDWTYEKAALHSSSYMKLGPLMNWFSGNIGYHHIHHLNSRIPFYRLPEAFRGIKELQSAKETNLKLRSIIGC